MISDSIQKINWSDFVFDSLEINDDKVLLFISNDETSQNYKIVCDNYIGIRFLNHWDESVLSGISVLTDSGFIEQSLNSISKNYENENIPGNNRDIKQQWYEIRLEFIDDSILSVICNYYHLC